MSNVIFRSRTQGALKSGGNWYEHKYPGAQLMYTGSGEAVGTIKKTDDCVVRNFHKRSKNGEVIMNPYSNSTCVRTLTPISLYSYTDTRYGLTYTQSGFPDAGVVQASGYTSWPSRYDLISSSEVGGLTTEASTRVLSAIGRASTDSWENLAETQKTVGMLWSPIKSFMRFDKRFQIASAGLSAANAWLMYRYGIMPLINSVDGVLTALNRNVIPLRKTTRAQATANATYVGSVTWTAAQWQRTYRIQKTESHTVRAMSLDTVVRSMYNDLGFDSKSLIQLPWNLIPYSFVADWFLNVGDYIGALGQAFQPQSLGRCTVHQSVLSQVRQSTNDVNTNSYQVLNSKQLLLWRQDNVYTTRDLGLSAPGIVFKSNFRLDDVTRVGDALALIGQRVLSSFLGRK